MANLLWQNIVQIALLNATWVGRCDSFANLLHIAKTCHALAWRNVVATTHLESKVFQMLLKAHSGKAIGAKTVGFHVLFGDGNNKCAVAVDLIACVVGHSVDNNGVFRAVCRHNHTTRTHAKRVASMRFVHLVGKFVGCRTKVFVCGKHSVLRFVDKIPCVLYAHANGKGLELHFHAHVAKQLKNVPCRVATAQQNVVGKQGATVVQLNAVANTVLHDKICDGCVEKKLSTTLHNAVAKVGNNGNKLVRANVGKV